MNKIVIALVSMFMTFALSAQMPRSEWHAKGGECVLDPVLLKSTISKVSSADKVAFLAEVNAAIGKMPGSAEVKAAQYLVANRAAIAGAGSADRAAVLAEVFATVPPEALTVINEEFAKSEFSRPATMNDAQFTRIVSLAMSRIAQRCASAESSAIRIGFAGLMFVRAAGTAAESAQTAAIASLPRESQNEASSSWYPAALGKDQVATYDPMLAAAQAGEEPDHVTTIGIYSQQIVESMLADLQAGVLPNEQADGVKLSHPPADFFNFDVDAMSVRMIEPSRGRIMDRFIPESMLSGDPSDRDTTTENPYYSDGRHNGDRDYDGDWGGGGSGGSSGGGSGGGGEPGPYPWQRL